MCAGEEKYQAQLVQIAGNFVAERDVGIMCFRRWFLQVPRSRHRTKVHVWEIEENCNRQLRAKEALFPSCETLAYICLAIATVAAEMNLPN